MKLYPVNWCSDLVNIPGVSPKAYYTETAFQVYCADWLRKRYELTGNKAYAFWHHSANERNGSIAGFRAKMMGQAKGWPDFVHCGLRLAIELKVPGGSLSPFQVKWLDYFKGIGWHSEAVFCFERFRTLVLERAEN